MPGGLRWRLAAAAALAGVSRGALGLLALGGPPELAAEDEAQGAQQTVSIHLLLTQDVPVDGYVEVTAPGGFSLAPCSTGAAFLREDACSAPFPDCRDDNGAGVASADLRCDANATTARLYLLTNPLHNRTRYVLRLPLQNPPSPSAAAAGAPWRLATYGGTDPVSGDPILLDTATFTGFLVTTQADLFRMDSSPAANGLAPVRWEFTLQFDEAVYSSEVVTISAPKGYSLQRSDDDPTCSQYTALVNDLQIGDAACDSYPCIHVPSCSGNTLTWQFLRCPGYKGPALPSYGLCLLPASTLRFGISSQNPQLTPAWNRFLVRHLSADGQVISSITIPSYRIYPLLRNFSVELNSSSGKKFQSVGSESVVRISFVAAETVGSGYIAISGGVAGQSFRLRGASVYDETLNVRLPIREVQPDRLVVERAINEPGEAVVLTLSPLQNPAVSGVSIWSVATYRYWNAIQGTRMIINQALNAPGFAVLGFVAVQGIGTSTALGDAGAPCAAAATGASAVSACPAFYGRRGILDIAFKTSVDTPQGDEVVIVAPLNYAFVGVPGVTAAGTVGVLLGSQLLTANLTVVNGGIFSGRWTLFDTSSLPDASPSLANTSQPTFRQEGASRFLYWNGNDRRWTIGEVPGGEVRGYVGEARSPYDGGGDGDPVGTVPFTGWEVGTAAPSGAVPGWSSAPDLRVLGEGSVDGSKRSLVLRLGRELSSGDQASLETQLDLPTLDQVAAAASLGNNVERKWLLETREVDTNRLYATNDELFLGFSLVQQLSFSVSAALTAPQIRISITLRFDQLVPLSDIGISNPSTARYDLTAPSGFLFPVQCMSPRELAKPTRLFTRCAGAQSIASLLSASPTAIKGKGLTVELSVDTAASTPVLNIWSLEYFLQGSAQRSGHGESPGFEISSMPVIFYGHTQLGQTSMGYFTFWPDAETQTPGGVISVTPPNGAGYTLSCLNFRRCSLPRGTVCGVQVTSAALLLRLPASFTLPPQEPQTVGIQVTNPNQLVLPANNRWKVLVVDGSGTSRDANNMVAGMRLASAYLSVLADLGVDRPPGGGLVATVQVTVSRDLPSGALSTFVVTAPAGFTVTGNSTPLGLALAGPVRLLPNATPDVGPALLWNVSTGRMLARGPYGLQVLGSITKDMASVGPGGGLWLLQAFHGGDLLFQQAVSGFAA